jgi:hypothetical protein
MCNWFMKMFGCKCNCQKAPEHNSPAAPTAAQPQSAPNASQPGNPENKQ